MAVGSWLAILVSVGVLFFSFLFTPGPEFNRDLHLGLGRAVAGEAVKLLGTKGRIILLHRDTAVFKNPATDAQIKGFQRALAEAGHKVALTNLLRVDPLRITGVLPGDFLEILKRTSEPDVVVSFLGPPTLSLEQQRALRAKPARVVAVCAGSTPQQTNLKDLFERGLLHAGILSRLASPPRLPESASPQAWFDLLYQVVTPANLGDLPASAAR